VGTSERKRSVDNFIATIDAFGGEGTAMDPVGKLNAVAPPLFATNGVDRPDLAPRRRRLARGAASAYSLAMDSTAKPGVALTSSELPGAVVDTGVRRPKQWLRVASGVLTRVLTGALLCACATVSAARAAFTPPEPHALLPTETDARGLGDTPASLRVSADGEARYEVPLWVPPGRAELQPPLALNYVSRAGNGLLGVGWRLAGTSESSRCRRIQAQDGVNAPIEFSNSDAFCQCVAASAQERGMERIPLALLLKIDRRTPEDVERTIEVAARLGLEITGHGRTSVTARASPEVFTRLFGTTTRKLPAQPPGATDAGRPAGYAATGPLRVPPELTGLVEQITVSSPARRL
jgi:hypothetical protein